MLYTYVLVHRGSGRRERCLIEKRFPPGNDVYIKRPKGEMKVDKGRGQMVMKISEAERITGA